MIIKNKAGRFHHVHFANKNKTVSSLVHNAIESRVRRGYDSIFTFSNPRNIRKWFVTRPI